MLRDLLCALGLACAPEPVQPDVSAFTILTLLVQTEAVPERMQPALGSLYEIVDVSLQATHPNTGVQSVLYRLSRGGVEKATLRCDTITHPDQREAPGWADHSTPKLAAALSAPWGDDQTHRSACIFGYLDTLDATVAFHTQAEMWTEHEIGALIADPAPGMPQARSAKSEAGTIHVSLTHGGLAHVSHAVIRIVMDLSTP